MEIVPVERELSHGAPPVHIYIYVVAGHREDVQSCHPCNKQNNNVMILWHFNMIDTSAERDNKTHWAVVIFHASLDMENCSSWNGGLVSSNSLFMVIELFVYTKYLYMYLIEIDYF